MQIKALLSGLVLASLCAASAGAELRDVSYGTQGGDGLVWLSFDEQPQAVTMVTTQTGVELAITGVSARSRTIAPYRTDLVSQLQVSPQGDAGLVVTLTAQRAWSGARADVYSGGVLVRMTLVGDSAPVASAPSSPSSSASDAGAISRTAPGGDFADRAPAHAASTTPDADTTPVDHMATDAGPAAAASDHTAQPEPDAPAPTPVASAPPSQTPASAAPSQTSPPAECAAQAAAVEESPWDDERLFAHAACLSSAGDLGRAAGIYEQMLAFEPENFRALIALAELRVEQGNDAGARDLYSQAASHAISDAEAARARARLRELREN
jgi:hypothetical protein